MRKMAGRFVGGLVASLLSVTSPMGQQLPHPAIVGAGNTAEAHILSVQSTNRAAIKFKFGSDVESTFTYRILIASSIQNPNAYYDLATDELNEKEMNSLEEAARNGWADNFSKILLAIRQMPFIGENGSDNARELTAIITAEAFKVHPQIDVFYSCVVSDDKCKKLPISKIDLGIVTDAYDLPPTRDMNASRAIPITRSVAAINGFFDGVMNTGRFLPPHPDGAIRTATEIDEVLRASVEAIRKKTPEAEIRRTVALCLNNGRDVTIADCARAGARMGVGFIADSGVRYDGATQVSRGNGG